jgi:predicted O-linked N-acetylglucosamine transferase (SPINDLY family)
VSKYFLEPLFAHRSQEEFELFLYSCTRTPDDEQTVRLRGLTDWWRDARALDDDQLTALIGRDRIDILVDLDMHTDGNRLLLFARKPAPIQLCWLAYAGTTGLSTMDYRISDRYLEPAGAATDCHSERTICLPNCFWCYDPLTQEPNVNALPALTARSVRYGSLNHYLKINDSVIAVWARVLNAVTGSKLVLFAPEGDIRDDTLIAFDRHGVNATRIEFVKRLSRSEYLATYNAIDICLDTFPYNGGATSLDAFWMGVPVVTMKGEVPMGRAGYSIAMNLGLGELVASTHDEYVQIAEGLSTDLERLARLRSELRHRMQTSPLMDGPQFARDMERLQREIWQRWCSAPRAWAVRAPD